MSMLVICKSDVLASRVLWHIGGVDQVARFIRYSGPVLTVPIDAPSLRCSVVDALPEDRIEVVEVRLEPLAITYDRDGLRQDRGVRIHASDEAIARLEKAEERRLAEFGRCR